MRPAWLAALALCACAAPTPEAAEPELPLFVLTVEDSRLSRSCRVRIPPGVVLHDAEGDGVLQVVADGVTLEFEPGSHLLGSHGAPWDEMSGVGVNVQGVRGVTLRGLNVSGFKVGVLATDADGLTLEDCDVSDNFRQRLHSTPQAADDASDWLRPHANDGQEWRRLYGAGICIEGSRDVTVRRCRARRVQNGLILDRVSRSEVYDNDFSFLSGWGVALWRACDNVIARNALDYCVRGYSEGVYNRGQDSAGVLLFEQSSRNLFAENSITHGGDGVFGFAGSEALGEAVAPVDFDYTRAGSNDNVFVGNDLSNAVAHGLELTFSFGTVIARNRFEGNKICGVWAGYCRDTWIFENEFAVNGHAGYGLEAGGINIEHGERNRILDNDFAGDDVGVHLWWDPDEGLTRLPWADANGVASDETLIARNTFRVYAGLTGLLLRDAGLVGLHLNTFRGGGTAVDARGATELQQLQVLPATAMAPLLPDLAALPGETRPVGARSQRGSILLDEWGPWDHESPFVRLDLRTPRSHGYLTCAIPGAPRLIGSRRGLELTRRGAAAGGDSGALVVVEATQPGIHPYEIELGTDPPMRVRGTLSRLDWSVQVFPWTVDPREDVDGWRLEATSTPPVLTDAIDLRLGAASPADVEPPLAPPGFQTERFGVLAETEFVPNTRQMTVRTVSDDGVRVWWNGELVIDNWTVHGPTTDEATLTIANPGAPVRLRVEHFELDGDATLVVELDAR